MHPPEEPGTTVLPLLEEDLTVRTERRETGAVRVTVQAREAAEAVALDTWTESTEVERRRVDRTVDARREPWHEGEDVLVVPVYEERVVVSRVLVLAEEVRLRTVRQHRTELQTVLLRREHVRIQRRGADGIWADDAAASEAGDSRPSQSLKEP